jgi:hypothetical protein
MKKSKLLLFLLVVSSPIFGQNQEITQVRETNDGPLTIGITETPPFITKNGDSYTGVSVASWQMVNDKLNRDFNYKTYPSLKALMKGVQSNEVDFSINPITVTDGRMKNIDFSQPYFISHKAIAQKNHSQVWSLIKNLISWKFFTAILALVAILFLFGFLVWLFERRKNKEEFGGKHGLAQGFWWSAVTMTTVGYGDKSPQTTGGRVVGLIWMFMAIIILSSLTAGIASALTVQSISNEISSVSDLKKFDVITVSNSSSQEFLDLYSINYNAIEGVDKALDKLNQGDNAVLIYDQPILKNRIEKLDLGDDITILPNKLKKDYYSYSFPKGSPLAEKINPLLIETLKSMKWNNLLKDYD